MDPLYDRLNGTQAEKLAFRLAKARYREGLDVADGKGCQERR